MASPTNEDEARFDRPRHLPGVELVTVAYRDRSFPEHSHAEYVIGAVLTGAETLAVGGGPHLVGAGDVLLLHPDEPHANATLGPETLRYRVLYVPPGAVRPFLDPTPFAQPLSFEEPVTDNAAIFRCVNHAHATLADTGAGPLEQESALAALLGILAESAPRRRRARPEAAGASATITLCREYIDDRFTESFGLQALGELTGLSIFHLVRSFKKSVGLTPLAYRNQRRVMEARARLLAGHRAAQVALDLGYSDQSHLTRQFQRIVGVSPGRYAKQ
ncbi:AraC family transcriptional regulator [Phenylobacterium sp.]|uniref:AraC family transcriptional regulator n=1 Tax=Phenylobacterium sp. TaxID=1871053 RepID=UPI001203334F|nr:AraC family transcriptional regulator [Phenylobacterium sp.]THD60814.1 MAG: AraC family transcriptional regulator [Phenylobacterium sp.]